MDPQERPPEEEWSWNGPGRPIKGQLALFEPPARSSTFEGEAAEGHPEQMTLAAALSPAPALPLATPGEARAFRGSRPEPMVGGISCDCEKEE